MKSSRAVLVLVTRDKTDNKVGHKILAQIENLHKKQRSGSGSVSLGAGIPLPLVPPTTFVVF